MTQALANPFTLASGAALSLQASFTTTATPLQPPCNTPDSLPAPIAQTAWDRSSDDERGRALHRLAAVRRAEALFAAGHTRAEADAQAASEVGVSLSAVSGWRRRIKQVATDDQAAALLDAVRSGRPGQTWSRAGAEVLWEHFVTDWLRLERPEATAVWRRTRRIAQAQGWTMPPIEAFRRRLRSLPRPERVRGRDGAVAAMDLAPHVTRTVAGLVPMEIINGDGKRHDQWVRLPSGGEGRPVVWYWQDVMSRKILAWAAGEAETADLIQTSLHEVIMAYGVPGKVVIDNTRAASSKSLTGGQKARKRNQSQAPEDELPGTLKLLGITYATTSVDRDDGGKGVGRGRAKPIERAFGDLCLKIDTHPRLAGSYTGRSPQDRPETHRSKAADWQIFMAVVAECVAEHNARPGRTSEAAFGRSLDEAFDEAMARVVMRRLAPAQARLLLMTAERVRVQANATVTLKIGHTPGQPRNRYHDPLLVERAGETLVARIDPDDLHGRILLHDEQGRFVCAAGCLHPVGWKDTASAKTYERGRRRMDTASRKAVAARRDMDALIEALRQVPTPTTATPVEPAATRLVTDSNLPQLPPAMPIDKEGLLERIEARRREFGMSPADLGLLILNALGKQVVSPGQLSAANLERLLGQLDEGVTWVEPSAEITPAPAPTSPGRGNSFMTALKRVQQAEENFG